MVSSKANFLQLDVRIRIALLLFIAVLLFLPAPVSAMCADTESCRIFSASMLTILCIPIYIIGFIILAIPATRPGSIVFGILAILAGAQATFAVVPLLTRPFMVRCSSFCACVIVLDIWN